MKKWSKELIAKGMPKRQLSAELLAEQQQPVEPANRWEALKTALMGKKV